ncbi:MAG: ribonuclease H-like domain-containing protein [bacterium]|nr:ribonuclease H-like domain-containing protein [bacterium]
MRKVVFDIETSNLFSEVGSNDPSKLDLSVIGIYDSGDETYQTYFQEELPKLWPVIERADMIIGYNSEHFDLPLLNKYYPGDLSQVKHIDLMKEIKKVLGRRIKLDTIAEATLGKKKTGEGLQAIYWWRNGEKEKVCKYCLEDVKITKEIYDFARAENCVKYREGGILKTLPLDASKWEDSSSLTSAITHTLPF